MKRLHLGLVFLLFPSSVFSFSFFFSFSYPPPLYLFFFFYNRAKGTLAKKLWASCSEVSFPKMTAWSGALMKAPDVSKFLFFNTTNPPLRKI